MARRRRRTRPKSGRKFNEYHAEVRERVPAAGKDQEVTTSGAVSRKEEEARLALRAAELDAWEDIPRVPAAAEQQHLQK